MKFSHGLLIGTLLLSSALPFAAVADTNHSSTPEMADSWIHAKLATTYLLNRHLNSFDIDVDVKDHTAILTGAVSTPVEKELAEEIAKSVNGVKKVDNRLQIVKDSATRSRKATASAQDRSFGEVVEDLTTTASIKSKLLMDSNVAGLSINVDTFKDKVTLSGNVHSDAEGQLAEQIAKNTEGVESVSNKLNVNPRS